MILSFLLLISNIFGASCCGGSSVGLPLIVESEKANFISRYVFSEVQDSVDSSGIWNSINGQDSYTTLKLEGSYAFEKFQLNAGFDIVKTELGEQSDSGMGDSYIGGAYQILDDEIPWYKPRLFHYVRITLPTGTSIYEADSPEEARGKGFWNLGTGLHIYKLKLPYDFTIQTEVFRGIKKSFSREDLGTYEVDPGYGGNILVGTGYNYKAARLGTFLDWNWQSGVKTTLSDSESSKRHTTWGLNASVMIEEQLDIVVSYFDQTLFGNPSNTELTRGVSLGLQKKWY